MPSINGDSVPAIQASEVPELVVFVSFFGDSNQKDAEKVQRFFRNILVPGKLHKVATWCQHCLGNRRRLQSQSKYVWISFFFILIRWVCFFYCFLRCKHIHPPTSHFAATFSSSLFFTACSVHPKKSMKPFFCFYVSSTTESQQAYA